jgi:predicted nucleotidyltransferase
MDYKDKYLKYRQKYIALKALKVQIGGVHCWCGGDHHPDEHDIYGNSMIGGAKCEICGGNHSTEECPKPPAAAAPVAASGDSDDGWTTVAPKTRNPSKPKKEVRNISLEELKEILNSKLAPYSRYIFAGYVYGSRARRQNRPDSDADIIIFWKSTPDIEFLNDLRQKIEEALGFEIDFVSCWYTKDFVENDDDRDKAYFGNVIGDAVQFIGEKISINVVIERSQKLSKLKRK